ncbi:MAG: PGF-CTERM sorting domain-containing protein [Euryarchaeota archaeon]|nr:PGF-CTERM sorting domain-containing protein [Euryarchaeota archaeon]
MKKITIVALVVLMLLTAALPASAAVKVSSVEIRGSVASGTGVSTTTTTWDKSTFAGFFYDLKDNLGLENLTITENRTSARVIDKSDMTYTTNGEAKQLKVVSKQYSGNPQDAINRGLEQFADGSMATKAGNYTIVGWMAEKYIAVKNKPYKLAKLLVEHGAAASEKKTLTVGESWEVGSGYTLTANSIDAKASPRQVWLTLSKDGVKKDDKVVTAGTNESKPIYTYVEANVCGENDVPVFITYVDSVFAGATTDMVQLRYTWLMSATCTEVKSGDVFGNMKVSNQNPLTLKNSESTVTLSQDTSVSVMGDIKLKVADSTDLRYYPIVLKTTPGIYEVRGKVASGTGTSITTTTWNKSSFAGFFYDLKDNLGLENLTITENTTSSRLIDKNDLVYTTDGEAKQLKVVSKQYSGVPQSAIDKGLEQFADGSMATKAGNYTIVGWMAEKYIAVKNKPYKLSKLLVEHGAAASEKKTLTVGESWEVGAGYTLTANSIDAKASPRQVWLTLSKDGVKKDDKVVTAGTDQSKPIYTYVEASVCGENDVPVFVTYVDSVFAGATTDMVQLRYTWLMSNTCTEVKSGDVFGNTKVSNQNPLTLKNSESTISLSSDTTVSVLGEIKLKVADDTSNLRYYPMVEYEIIGDGTTTGTPSGTVVATTPAKTSNVTTPVATTVGEGAAVTTTTATAVPTTPKTEPGFEAVFAIAGLLAVAFLVLRQRK